MWEKKVLTHSHVITSIAFATICHSSFLMDLIVSFVWIESNLLKITWKLNPVFCNLIICLALYVATFLSIASSFKHVARTHTSKMGFFLTLSIIIFSFSLSYLFCFPCYFLTSLFCFVYFISLCTWYCQQPYLFLFLSYFFLYLFTSGS